MSNPSNTTTNPRATTNKRRVSSFFKELARSISSSWGRFFAIMGIAALGCGFYAGLQMTGIDMRHAADTLYDSSELYDIRLVSTLGFSDGQAAQLKQHNGIEKAMESRSIDVMAELNAEQYAMRLESVLPEMIDEQERTTLDSSGDKNTGQEAEKSRDNRRFLNYMSLEEGRWPKTKHECVMSADRIMGRPVKVGDKLHVLSSAAELDEQLSVCNFEVVGLVNSSTYVSTTSLGPTSIGGGYIEQFVYVLPDSFADDFPANQIYVQVAGAMSLLAGSDAYNEQVDKVVESLETESDSIAQQRLNDVKIEASSTLESERKKFEQERADAYRKLDEAAQELKDAEQELQDAEQELADGRARYEEGLREYEEGEASAKTQFVEAQRRLDEAAEQLNLQAAQLAQAQAQAAAASQAQSMTAEQAQAALQAQTEAQAQFDAARAQIEAGQLALDQERLEVSERMDQAKTELTQAKSELDAGQAKVDKGREDLARGQNTYERERTDAEKQIADAQKKIDDAQADIDALEKPEIYVLDRTRNSGAESYQADSERIDNIAQVFPLIFFLVAALVSLTTMTRMVEDERQEIGTYKALGYGTARITAKYLLYAAIAGSIGAAVGIAVLSQILPYIICVAYDIMYSVPLPSFPLPINLPIALSAGALGVGVTLLATWLAAASTLRESPAQLMLPRAPKAGKRILLEHIGPLWKHTSFSWKVSFRNLFRYKRRFLMTVIGIAGCTALLLTGLGLRDSIWDIIDKQYDEIVHYDTVVTLEKAASEEELLTAEKTIQDTDPNAAMIRVMLTNVQVGSDSHDSVPAQLVVPQDNADVAQLLSLRTRLDKTPLELGQQGVILSEKLSRTLALEPGVSLKIYEQDDIGNAVGAGLETKLDSVCENYVYNYCYMDKELYQTIYGKEPNFTTIYARTEGVSTDHSELSRALHAIDKVETVAYNDEVIDSYRKSLRSVNMIVVVLVVAAAALAFIVLYNLTNINIVERTREIASLKVLGFMPHEVSAYVNRETMLLSGIGAALGLALGTIMEEFVVVSSEVEMVMFGREIHLPSYVIAFVVTLIFTLIVMLFMQRKLSSIDMVESLKSVD